MGAPLFAAGENVLYWLPGILLPYTTTVLKVVGWKSAGDPVFGNDGHQKAVSKLEGWWYETSERICHECCLRKLNPGEYTEDTQDLRAPIESGVGV